MDVATKEYVDNLAINSETTDSYDAYLEFDALEGLQAALAE
jgi:hypothetical protein